MNNGHIEVLRLGNEFVQFYLDPIKKICTIKNGTSNNDYAFSILNTTKECVINIPTVDIAQEVVESGKTSTEIIDKLKLFDLTPTVYSLVKAPLMIECYANFKCKIINTEMVPKYIFLFLQH